MRHLKLGGLCLIAIFSIVAVAATGSASAAEPEWGHCVPVKSKGHFQDSNCTKEDFSENKAHVKKYKGKFEWNATAAAACYPQKHGKYKDSACAVEDVKKGKPVGKYEKTGGAKFTGESPATSKPLLLTTLQECRGSSAPEECSSTAERGGETGVTVECASEHATGEAISLDEVANVHVVFKGCLLFGQVQCSDTANEGEIAVNQLVGKLGYLNKAAKEVGVDLKPATGTLFAEFNCVGSPEGYFHVAVGEGSSSAPYSCADWPGCGGDGIISPVAPVDQMTHTFTQEYKGEVATEKGHAYPEELTEYFNVPRHFEGGPDQILESYTEALSGSPPGGTVSGYGEWMDSSESLTNINTVEGEAEIKG